MDYHKIKLLIDITNMADTTMICEDGNTLTYSAALFRARTRLTLDPTIPIKYSFGAVKTVLLYIYMGDIPQILEGPDDGRAEIIEQIQYLAHDWNLQLLSDEARHWRMKKLSVDLEKSAEGNFVIDIRKKDKDELFMNISKELCRKHGIIVTRYEHVTDGKKFTEWKARDKIIFSFCFRIVG
jgi:hypothetical protein